MVRFNFRRNAAVDVDVRWCERLCRRHEPTYKRKATKSSGGSECCAVSALCVRSQRLLSWCWRPPQRGRATRHVREPPLSATRRRGSVMRSLAVEPAVTHAAVEPSSDVSAFDYGVTFDDVDDGTNAFDVDGGSSSVRARGARGVGATTALRGLGWLWCAPPHTRFLTRFANAHCRPLTRRLARRRMCPIATARHLSSISRRLSCWRTRATMRRTATSTSRRSRP